MKNWRGRAFAVAAILMIALLAGLPSLFAQDQPDQNQPDQNPPTRIARLDYASGSVSFQPGGTGDWVTADQNRPLTTGDNIWADQNSRAELHIGSTAIRLDSQTSVTFLDLGDQTTQLRLSAGSVILRVRNLDGTFEVDTPNLAFDVQRDGEYRLDVSPDGNETDVTVWQGAAEVTGGGTTYNVIADQQVRFTGMNELDHEVSAIPASDDFANWAFLRDQQEDQSQSARYVSPEMTGYQDLDAYGQWRNAGSYGMVWVPGGLAPGWAPYRFGHWVWISPWGWTWVENEPWGFAPFHYGRWAYYQNSWCWVPGPVAVRPVYAPALVAFVGGGGFSLSIGVGGGPGVAWFPLAPGEVFVPYYRTNRVYVQNINVTNTRVSVTRITNVYNVYNSRTTVTNITYVNRSRGVTAVSRDTFINARPVARNVVRVNAQQISRAPVTHNLGFQPQRQSVIGTARPAQVRPPARFVDRQVVATRAPVAPQRPNFETRQPMMNVRQVQRQTPVPVGRTENRPGGQPGVRVNERPQPLGQNVPQGRENNVPRPPGAMPNRAPNQGPGNARPEYPRNGGQPNNGQAQPMPQRNPQQQPGNAQPQFRTPQNQPENRQPEPRPQPEVPRPDNGQPSQNNRPQMRPQEGSRQPMGRQAQPENEQPEARPQPESPRPESGPPAQNNPPQMRPQEGDRQPMRTQPQPRQESRPQQRSAPPRRESPPKEHHEEKPSK